MDEGHGIWLASRVSVAIRKGSSYSSIMRAFGVDMDYIRWVEDVIYAQD